MKRSLGRRSSSRNPPRATPTPFTGFGSTKPDRMSGIPVRRAASTDRNNMSTMATPNTRHIRSRSEDRNSIITYTVRRHGFGGGSERPSRQDRKSGIPVRRAASTDRNNMSTMVTPITTHIRSISEDRNSKINYTARSQGFGGGTERPSRATTFSTNSARLSSYGGARKRDNRPIDDKDWQMAAQRRIEGFLMQEPEGCRILVNGSIKPITLQMFISIIDLLLRRLDGNENRTYIHKDNYITEVPFVMKKLLYRGKIEKSWLITVNTVRSWGHVLACIDFLVSCVTSQIGNDPVAVMFPGAYEKDSDDFWDHKVLLPYFQKSYALFMRNDPKYEEIQDQYDREVIELHVSNDNVFERVTNIQCEIKRVNQETATMKMQLEKVQQELHSLGEKFNNLKDEKAEYEEHIEGYKKFKEEAKIASDNMDKEIEKLQGELERLRKNKAELEKAISNQQLSHCQISELKQRRDSLQREVNLEQEFISIYENLVHQLKLEVLGQKMKVEYLISKYNLEVIKFLPLQFESTLDAKYDEAEMMRRLNDVQEAINSAKRGLHSLKESDAQQLIEQIKYEIQNLDKKLADKRNKIKTNEEKNINIIKEKEEIICRMKSEIESITEKMANLNVDPELKATLEEKEKLANRMEKQLETMKANMLHITTECIKIKQEFEAKFKALQEEYRMKLNQMKK